MFSIRAAFPSLSPFDIPANNFTNKQSSLCGAEESEARLTDAVECIFYQAQEACVVFISNNSLKDASFTLKQS